MKITEQQLFILFELARWFSQLNMVWGNQLGPPFTREGIHELVVKIFDQQGTELREIK